MNTPILLITFNRPDHTRQVLQRILEANPQDLYIFQDGAREGNINDAIKCAEVRQVIEDLINNHQSTIINHQSPITNHQSPITNQKSISNQQSSIINLHTNYSRVNLGCGAGPMTGISWFFENVEQGIVMEDDCLAHPDFFPYCEKLLDRYKGTEVKFINSTLYDDSWSKALNHQSPITNHQSSYGFSRYMCTGAWASYREVWQGFDLDLKTLNTFSFYRQVKKITHNVAEAEWWWYQVRAIQKDNSKKSYWDYQMQIHLFRQNALTIHPAVNLISNIGFDAEGTHTTSNDGRGDREVYSIMPLKHPEMVEADRKRDMHCWAKKQSRGKIVDCLLLIYHIWAWRNKFVQ